MPSLTVAAPTMIPQSASTAMPRLSQPEKRPSALKRLIVAMACVRSESGEPWSSSSSSSSSMISRLRNVAVSRRISL